MISVFFWWIALFLIGIGFLPLTLRIFRGFPDRGWLFAKTIGLFLSGALLFAFAAAGLLPFSDKLVLLAVIAISVVLWIVGISSAKYGLQSKDFVTGGGSDPLFSKYTVRLIIAEEIIFLGLMLVSVYIIGFKPDAYGTEKLMDYAFLTAMERSASLPFPDPWFSGKAVNYYYGGHYMAAFLMKLTGTSAGLTYNLARGLITSLSFALPFSLLYGMVFIKRGDRHLSLFGGVLGGCSTAFAGNGHYLIYDLFPKIRSLITGSEHHYWFPDSTRFIGFDPDIPDKTIHEFPAYSSILGDLHAHYINIIFVITALAIACAWSLKRAGRRSSLKNELLAPEIILIGIFTGLFRWTNAADLAIFYVVCGSIIFFTNIITYGEDIRHFIAVTAAEAAFIFGIGYIAALPFTLKFKDFTYGIFPVHSHTEFRQLLILWGLPVGVLAGYSVCFIFMKMAKKTTLPDMWALLFGLCAAGLVLLPELVYVKDIYGDDHYRSNTMFKLTYGAFILFSLMMPYVLSALPWGKRTRSGGDGSEAEGLREPYAEGIEVPRGSAANASPASDFTRGPVLIFIARLAAGAALILLVLTFGFTANGVKTWFGNIFDPGRRIGTDASVFVERYFPSDAGAIAWLNKRIPGEAVILEASGDSYSGYARVSSATGMSTVAGWYVHEWLWRAGHEEMDERVADIRAIYTASDPEIARELIDKYGINFVYVGALEREQYPGINETLIRSLGEIAYEDEGAYIVWTLPNAESGS